MPQGQPLNSFPINTASNQHTALPRCDCFGRCGGCTYQDIAYAHQLTVKYTQLADLLKTIDVVPQPVIPCLSPWRYRNKMEFAFGSDSNGTLVLGLRRKGAYWDVLDVRDCHLQSASANLVRIVTREFFSAKSYRAYDPDRHDGLLRFLIVRESQSEQKLMVNLVVAQRSALHAEDIEAWLQTLRRHVPQASSVYLSQQSQHSDTAFTEDLHLLWGVPELYEVLQSAGGPLRFVISPLAFFQTNTGQAQVLYDTALRLAQVTATDTVLDLYCGTGTIGQMLAANAKWVFGVEAVGPALADARRNAQANGIHNVTYITDKVETWLKWNGDDVAADVWILDPPRSGLHPKILGKRLPEMESRPKLILYISCNPKHLPADLAKLQQWYTVEVIQPVDMFPQTPHLEVIVVLRRRT